MNRRHSLKLLLGAATAAGTGVLTPAQAQAAPTTDAAALSKARATGNKKRAQKVFYTKKFDLSGLPDYQPEAAVKGEIRQWGDNYLKDSGLIDLWEQQFRQFQPGASFADNLASSSVAFPGLITGAADLAPLGRQALWDELKGFEREGAGTGGEGNLGDTEVLEITVATGSYDVRGWTFALGAFVHKDNPIAKLSMEQLDGIFGAERSGGWNGLTWEPSRARGPEQNIRRWGQLGLSGDWADRPIHVYGYNFKYHFADEFDKKVLKASGKWNETLKMYSNEAGLTADGSLTPGGELMMDDLGKDPYGIAYTGVPFLTPQTKVLALAPGGGNPVELTLDNVQNRSYPLLRDVYYYARRQKGQPLQPKVKEFLRYILSRQGQEAVQRDGKYLPLTAAAAREQMQKLG